MNYQLTKINDKSNTEENHTIICYYFIYFAIIFFALLFIYFDIILLHESLIVRS